MSEMIERVAREVALEILELHTEAEIAAFRWPEDCPGDTADRAISRARRIIEAMREPDVVAIVFGAKAGLDQLYHKSNMYCRETCSRREDARNMARFTWVAMVDATLADSPP